MGVLADYLERAKVRPDMFIGEQTVSALYAFIGGFREALLFTGNVDPIYEGFNRWLQEQVLPPVEGNWRRVFLARGMTEDEALVHFFALWAEYRRRQAEAVTPMSPRGAGGQSSPSRR